MRTRNDGDHMMMSQARMSKDDSCRRRLAAARPKCNSHQGEEADWCQGDRQTWAVALQSRQKKICG